MSGARNALQFERLCAEVFRHLDFQVKTDLRTRSGKGVTYIDIVAERPGVSPLFIEVKWSPDRNLTLYKLRDWCARLSDHARLLGKRQFILIVSGYVEEAHRSWLFNEYDIDVWDRSRLTNFVKENTRAKELLEKFFHELEVDQGAQLAGVAKARPTGSARLGTSEAQDNRPLPARGLLLIKKLAETLPGNQDARKYEQLCLEIINYLFGEHLLDARPQSRTDDQLSILDIVYRVNPAHKFWETLTRDFRARAIVFECKNCSGEIGPQQVYTTERYMSVGALRSICFILCRNPPHVHALLAASGAMRESGKLLVFISDNDLIEMLKVKDAQVTSAAGINEIENDPTILLDQKIYEFIACVPR